MRQNNASSPNPSLLEISSYYRQCLALERQGESVFDVDVLFKQPKFPPHFFLVSTFTDSWDDLLATKAAQDATDLTKRGERRAVIFVPILSIFKDGNGKRWEPVTGVFCQLTGKTLKVDPTDIFIGRIIRSERSFEEISEIKAKLESAAKQSPYKFLHASIEVLPSQQIEEIPFDKLSQVTPPKIVKCFGFLVVGESPYDRALLEELDKLTQLKTEMISSSALNFLFAPPKIEEPSISDILLALVNPVRPTLSQAIALAHAMKAPLTVITGPPGTGKTHIIVGLIAHHLLTGKSVLLSSKINRAVDAAVELAERLMGEGCILRTGNQQEIEKLRERVDELLERNEWQKKGKLFEGIQQTYTTGTRNRIIANDLIQSVKAEVNQIAEQINKRCERLNRIGKKLSRFELRPICLHHRGKRELNRFLC
ncbi:MAG: AAA domain-containing protein, partial [Candidatus Kryptonium sp.]